MPTTPEEKLDGWVSITEVFDYFIHKNLLEWYVKTGMKEAKRISTVAMKIGTRVDSLIQDDIKNGSYKLSAKDPIEVANCMSAWEKFKKDYVLNIESIQTEVKDVDKKIIGHLDIVANNSVIDVKCANSIKPNYWLQVAKYDDLHKQYRKTAILRLDKNLGTYQFVTNEQANINVAQCVKAFDGLLEAYRFYNRPTA